MLSSLLREHQARQQARKEEQEKKRKEAYESATAFTHALVDHLNAGVAQAYVNQKKLDTETKILQINAGQFAKQTMQWLKLVEDFNTALKEIGDVENWARSIETDMRTVSSALEYAYKAEKQQRE
ncbi:biogenesis of lysosome-related organelles complex 1 subunit 1 isoform X3 [Lingula anatina]|uniref:Biogenesis of lysosome-related organelles complex 1 subunit 1 n=1 Tax=Lingula anatina TaxID=7574 RepID=A0A1S3K117_LINAN|nr:biogenesis of lysosome-related organelles complex 1 subunit 1 isoform X2 [Lingula anatina]XP_013415971.1 biogenesis of lysosome-related organelles complex 1 subunit 1 isoform X3 [Lingula anatina]|eukprot:XP_013415970.1 biogenesis of lysosome-related organelles complex 1 subunit 1 isoform X2 [Lingula anatina]